MSESMKEYSDTPANTGCSLRYHQDEERHFTVPTMLRFLNVF